jgi:hypothetical protein
MCNLNDDSDRAIDAPCSLEHVEGFSYSGNTSCHLQRLETVEPPRDNEAWAKSLQSSIASLAYHKRAHKLGPLVECLRCLEHPSSVVALKEYKRSELTIESFARAADQIFESICSV